ncbi:MAG: PBSX family phage terminase large subunit [Gemmatimonadales bacterium]|nr:PBSX family phage terminase large subunit [Gemmatimonadales bacterium]
MAAGEIKTIKPHLQVNGPLYDWLAAGDGVKRWNYAWGGAASAKSWTIADYLLAEKFCKEKNMGILCVRRSKPQVRKSCWRLIAKRLARLDEPFIQNKTELFYLSLDTGSRIYFDGVDDVLKLKSLEGINYIWVEEATELNHQEILQLNLRARAHNPYGINRIFLSFNPEDPEANEWLKDLTDAAMTGAVPDSTAFHVTFRDNPFLSEEECEQLERLVETDPEYNSIYNLGEWATPTLIIYSNWDRCEKLPGRYDQRLYGLDFGFSSDPCALVELRFVGNDVYCRELIYEKELTNPGLIARMRELQIDEDDFIIADSAEPKSIQEICDGGFNVFPCKKGPDSVRFGIRTVKKYRRHITLDSDNMLKEVKSYKWKPDKEGKPTRKPLAFRDHTMDAERYAISWWNERVEAGMGFVGESEPTVKGAEPEPQLTEKEMHDREEFWDDAGGNDDLWD